MLNMQLTTSNEKAWVTSYSCDCLVSTHFPNPSISMEWMSVWVDECVCVGGWVYEWMSVWVDECVSVCVGGWVCVYSVSNSAWVAKYVLGVS